VKCNGQWSEYSV